MSAEEEALKELVGSHTDSNACVAAFIEYFKKQMAAKDDLIHAQAEELEEARKIVEQHNKDRMDILSKYMVLLESKGAMADIQSELLAAQKSLLEKEAALVRKEEALQEAESALTEKDNALHICQASLDQVQGELAGLTLQKHVHYIKPVDPSAKTMCLPEITRMEKQKIEDIHHLGLSPREKHRLNRMIISATEQNNCPEVLALLEKGADVDFKDTRNFESTPLNIAAAHGFLQLAIILLEAGAEIDAKNSKRATPLMNAAWNGRLSVVNTLIAAGANLNMRGGDVNTTPLGSAILRGHLEVEQVLREAGARE